jgi:hypothetical protein
MPFDYVDLAYGKPEAYDATSDYDYRVCEADVVLTEADMAELSDFLADSSKGRADVDVDMLLSAGSGFHPFCPDKGDAGTFHVNIEQLGTQGIGERPYKYFKRTLRIVNQGAWPSYSLPAEVSEGQLTLGTVANLRFPPAWPRPEVQYASRHSLGLDGTVLITDRSSNADVFQTTLGMVCNESKAAALLAYLTNTARAGTFEIITKDNYFFFDYDKLDNNTHQVRLLQNEIVVTHVAYNDFRFDLKLGWVSFGE